MRAFRWALVVAVLASAVGVVTAHAAVLDQEQAQLALSAVQVGGPTSQQPQSQAQIFTAGASWRLERVELHLRREVNAQQAITVELRTVASGVPTTTVLASATFPAGSIPETAGWVAVPLEADLEGGTAYAIVAHTIAGDTYEWTVSAGDVYARGQRFYQGSPPGPTWTGVAETRRSGPTLQARRRASPRPAAPTSRCRWGLAAGSPCGGRQRSRVPR